MDKECDLNLSESNNYSNDELQDSTSLTDYSMSIDDSSALTLPNGAYQANNSYYSKYQTNSKSLIRNMDMQQGSSSAKQDDQVKLYIDQLMPYLINYKPEYLYYIQELIDKHKNGELDTGRTTPLLFPEMHALVKLDFPGLIYQLKPNSLSQCGGFIVISDEICPKDCLFIESIIDEYPGPLTPDRTSEDQLYYYLNEQLKTDLEETSPVDWDSGNLLLKYLELLIKENGKPRISNVVKLLNDGVDMRTANLRREIKQFDSISRNSFSRASSRATSRASSRAPSPENIDFPDLDLPQNNLDGRRGPGSVTSVMRRAVNNASHEQRLYQNMDKFREYIWSGRFEEAVNFAIRTEIWDHAFALALRLNNPTLVNEILVRFSRRAISSNDPLFTMHELMAGKPPRIVAGNRGFSNSEMGDWRSHLSMIVAIKKFRPEESRQAIESMGEKLLLLRNYFGAHLCFLLADTPFGLDTRAHKYRRKYDLLGWFSSTSTIPAQKSTYENCHRLYSGFKYWQSAPELYVKLTEVYEYSLRLRDDNSHRSLAVHLLPYKYLMALRMFDRSQTKTAYEYCRNIGTILGYQDFVWLKCESVTFDMVANIRNLSYKLHSLLTADEDSPDNHVISDISWLTNIDSVYCQLCQKYNFYNPMSTRPDYFLMAMINSAEDNEMSESHDGTETPMYHEHPSQLMSYGNVSTAIQNTSTPMQKNTDHQFLQQPQKQPMSYDNMSTQQRNVSTPIQKATDNHFIQQPQKQPLFIDNLSMLQRNISTPIQKSTDNRLIQQPQPIYPSMANNNPLQPAHQYDQSGKQFIEKPQPLYPSIGSNFQPPHQKMIDQSLLNLIPQSQSSYSNNNVHKSHRVEDGAPNFPSIASNIAQIVPPSELPRDMLTTSPPSHRRDLRTTSNVDRYCSGYTIGSQYIQGPPDHGGQSSQVQYEMVSPPSSSMFMPGLNNNENQRRDSAETVDYFATNNSRSRSQSNGSVVSISGDKSSHRQTSSMSSRSRHTSESKDQKSPVPVRAPLQSTKEETVDAHNHKKNTTEEKNKTSDGDKKKGWGILSLFGDKKSGVHLPEDTNPQVVYDPVKKLWIDTSKTEEDRPPTPPPLMPSLSSSKNPSATSASVYQGPAQSSGLSKYRQAVINVKPTSRNVSAPALPAFILPPTMAMNGPMSPTTNNIDSNNHNEPTSLLNGLNTHDNNQRHRDYDDI